MEKKDKNLNVPNLRFPEFSGEWEKHKLDEIATISKERIGVGMLSSSNYISTENMKSNFGGVDLAACLPVSGNVIKFQQGDTLLSNIRPYLKKIWQARFDGGCSADILVFRSNKLCNQDFLYYTLANEKFISYAMSGAKGVKMPRGDKEQILKYELHLPTATEQNKITSLLSLLDQRIETQKKVIEDLKKLKDAISKLLFSHRAGNEYTIGELCKSIAVKQYISIDVAIDGTYPIIQQGESPVAGYTESAPFFDYEKVILFGDHTLSIYRPNVPFLLSTDGIKILRPNDLVLRDYLYYLLYAFMPRSEGYKRHYSILKDICVPVPDIDTQKSIVEELLSVDSKIEIEVRVLKLQIQQKEYCLNQMFI